MITTANGQRLSGDKEELNATAEATDYTDYIGMSRQLAVS